MDYKTANSQPSIDSDATSAHRIPFSFRQQIEFTRKELRETLRDRRTIVTLLVMPLLLYPLLGQPFEGVNSVVSSGE